MVDVLALIDTITKEDNETVFIEQFVSDVRDFSSQYGSDISISYTAYNLAGKPSKYPDYGDYPQAFVMRTYGRWWKEAPSGVKEFMPQNQGTIISQDFIDVTFEQAVYPFQVNIYEIYNPGALVRVWARSLQGKWALLWEGAAQATRPMSRIFSPPLRTIQFPTNLLRLEFDHSNLEYYTELDAVCLVGTYKPFPENNLGTCHTLQNPIVRSRNGSSSNFSGLVSVGDITNRVQEMNIHQFSPQVDISNSISSFLDHEFPSLLKQIEDMQRATPNCPALPTSSSPPPEVPPHSANSGAFSTLPDESILHILGYLDLKDLCRCAQVNRHFRGLAQDPHLYIELGLRKFWHCVNPVSLQCLTPRLTYIQKLDMSWCGNYRDISPDDFIEFLEGCGKNLTHLRLNCCKFVTDSSIEKIASLCPKLQELALQNNTKVTSRGFFCLTSLHGLERLDFYRTSITKEALIAILKSSPQLRHLNLGSCMHISSMDEVVLTLSKHNTELVSLDLWKSYTLTSVGVNALGKCSKLEEVDLGWCLSLSTPGLSLNSIAYGCPKMKKIFLASMRCLSDYHLEPFLKNCSLLEQVDVLGCSVTADIISRLLRDCQHLKLVDVSFCDNISEVQCDSWRRQYPNVSIKQSYQSEAKYRGINS
ncbi:F-box/LRR-repeat protein 4 [Frankliniella fusca]|uniref:F-box/LRR-repeat protein 4 n=1 Tax=Frankliniella fusca TaxID=407009 RepID=A0AAE1LSM9_9NEOP|nr:F-box/LRR-repeat protein 4 [Frankliniella fusca]